MSGTPDLGEITTVPFAVLFIVPYIPQPLAMRTLCTE